MKNPGMQVRKEDEIDPGTELRVDDNA